MVFDGKTCNILDDERIMMYPDTDKLTAEIYTDNSGCVAELFSCRMQQAAAAELTETVQIITKDGSDIFEAVYDKDTEKFVHAYDKYTCDKYLSAQKECFAGYSL